MNITPQRGRGGKGRLKAAALAIPEDVRTKLDALFPPPAIPAI